MQKYRGERLKVNLAWEGMKGGPNVLWVLQVLQVLEILNDSNTGQHLAFSHPKGFEFAQHRPEPRPSVERKSFASLRISAKNLKDPAIQCRRLAVML